MNEAVLQAVEEHALTPAAIEQVIRLSERDDVTELQNKLTREQKDVAKRIARLVAVIETGGRQCGIAASPSCASWKRARWPSSVRWRPCGPCHA